MPFCVACGGPLFARAHTCLCLHVHSNEYTAIVTAVYTTLFYGFAVTASAKAVEAIAEAPFLAALEHHKPFSVGWPAPVADYDAPLATDSTSSTTSDRRQLQATPSPMPTAAWHLDRIDQQNLPLDGVYTNPYDGTGVVAYVVDTAIAPNSDFGGRMRFGAGFVGDGRDYDSSCMGHGTHVRAKCAGREWGIGSHLAPPVAAPVPCRVWPMPCRGRSLISSVVCVHMCGLAPWGSVPPFSAVARTASRRTCRWCQCASWTARTRCRGLTPSSVCSGSPTTAEYAHMWCPSRGRVSRWGLS